MGMVTSMKLHGTASDSGEGHMGMVTSLEQLEAVVRDMGGMVTSMEQLVALVRDTGMTTSME